MFSIEVSSVAPLLGYSLSSETFVSIHLRTITSICGTDGGYHFTMGFFNQWWNKAFDPMIPHLSRLSNAIPTYIHEDAKTPVSYMVPCNSLTCSYELVRLMTKVKHLQLR